MPGGSPYTFKAGLQDRATGWMKYGQRWYNAGSGRWTQAFSGGVSSLVTKPGGPA